MMLRRWIGVAAVALVALLTVLSSAACGDGGQAAANAAISGLLSSYDAVKEDAAKYVPDQAKNIDRAFAAVQDTFAKGDYAKAMTDAQGLTTNVSELAAAAAAKKRELTKAWEGLAGGMPGIVSSLQSQVETLLKARRLPRGVTKDALEAAKSAVPVLSASWDEAVAAFKAANLTDALSKAQAVKRKAVQIMASLGMAVPNFLK